MSLSFLVPAFLAGLLARDHGKTVVRIGRRCVRKLLLPSCRTWPGNKQSTISRSPRVIMPCVAAACSVVDGGAAHAGNHAHRLADAGHELEPPLVQPETLVNRRKPLVRPKLIKISAGPFPLPGRRFHQVA